MFLSTHPLPYEDSKPSTDRQRSSQLGAGYKGAYFTGNVKMYILAGATVPVQNGADDKDLPSLFNSFPEAKFPDRINQVESLLQGKFPDAELVRFYYKYQTEPELRKGDGAWGKVSVSRFSLTDYRLLRSSPPFPLLFSALTSSSVAHVLSYQ
jgi:hypothetical protein